MSEADLIAWLIWGVSVLVLGRLAIALLFNLATRGPRRLLRAAVAYLDQSDLTGAARAFSQARRKAYARGDLVATAAAWRGLAQVRSAKGDAVGAAAAEAAACDAERQAKKTRIKRLLPSDNA